MALNIYIPPLIFAYLFNFNEDFGVFEWFETSSEQAYFNKEGHVVPTHLWKRFQFTLVCIKLLFQLGEFLEQCVLEENDVIMELLMYFMTRKQWNVDDKPDSFWFI